jgi:hypothetical protein
MNRVWSPILARNEKARLHPRHTLGAPRQKGTLENCGQNTDMDSILALKEMIAYEDFEVESVSIELRYDAAYALWDRSGEVWTRLRNQYPELQSQSATPLQQVFETTKLRATIELEKFLVHCRGSDAEQRATEVAQSMLEVCSEHLRLSIFTRVGFREIKTQRFDSPEAAFAAAGPVAPTQFSQASPASSKTIGFSSGIRLEGEASGLTANIRGEEREIKLKFPWELSNRFEEKDIKEYVLLIDSDYFTVGLTPRSALDLGEWAKQASRSIRRFWKSTLS